MGLEVRSRMQGLSFSFSAGSSSLEAVPVNVARPLQSWSFPTFILMGTVQGVNEGWGGWSSGLKTGLVMKEILKVLIIFLSPPPRDLGTS